MKQAAQFIILLLLATSCLEDHKPSNELIEVQSTEMAENQEIEMPVEDDEPILYDAAVLHEILEYNDLGNLQMGSNIAVIKNTTLKPGDSIQQIDVTADQRSLKAYRFSSNGVDLIDFYTANNRINRVEILDAMAVENDMIAPGKTLKDLNTIDPSLQPYGSERESEVSVNYNGVTYLLDARHPIYEAIDLYPSTAIVKVIFKK